MTTSESPIKLDRTVVRVIRVDKEPAGTITPVVLYESASERIKRRVSKRERRFERALRDMMNAQGTFAQNYLQLHSRSNQKKKNGYRKDLFKNLSKSFRRGRKRLKRSRIFGF